MDKIVSLQARIDADIARERLDEATPVNRVQVGVQAGDLARIVKEVEAALIATGQGIYQRGGQLVRIATLEHDSAQHGVMRTAGSNVILPVTRDYLPLALARCANFRKFDGRVKEMRTIDAPSAVTSALIAAAGEWKFPSLAGIVSAPTLRSDGTLLNQPGYDAASHLFAAFDPDEFPKIDTAPSREQAIEALDLFDDLFGECSFEGGSRSAHASVAIAACITACVRHALATAPAFALSAHKAGSGKTTTAKVPAQLAMGRDPPVIAPTEDEAELKKALLAILIAGDAVVLIDNVARPVDSAALCAVLTSAIYSDRVLGVSLKVSVPTASTWLLTGNSIEFVGDLTSRVLLSMLDPECELPEARPFKRNLADYVLGHRGELVRAALSVPLAYIAAGRPIVTAPRSRFSDWDALVRYPLLWLGAADPIDTQAQLRASDPVRESLDALLRAWRNAFGDQPASIASAITAATAPGQLADLPLHEALKAIAGERSGEINARRLGRYIKRSVRRIEGGLRFEVMDIDRLTNRPQYRVASVTSVSSVSTNPSRENPR